MKKVKTPEVPKEQPKPEAVPELKYKDYTIKITEGTPPELVVLKGTGTVLIKRLE